MKGKGTFFDTNVLIYAFAEGDLRSDIAAELLASGGVTGVQMLNEFASVATRKLRMPWPDVLKALDAVRRLLPKPVPLTIDLHDAAVGIVSRYGYSIYDALAIAAALKAKCRTLYSEDLQDGQEIDRLVIRNPFASVRVDHQKK